MVDYEAAPGRFTEFGPVDDALLCSADTAECGCPERCDRDHGNE